MLLGKSPQTVTQTFTANINGANIGLAVMNAFGGDWAQLNIVKYSGYVSINGDTGGKVVNGRLVPGSYVSCN